MMRATNLLALVFLMLGCGTPTVDVAPAAIVGGAIDVDHDAVVYVHGPPGSCSGTLIENFGDGRGWVLTAAHCVDPLESPRTHSAVVADDWATGDVTWLTVESVHVHPAYRGAPEPASPGDIAVLGVIGVPAGLAPISPLRADEDRLALGSDYVAVGYGRVSASVSTSVRHAAGVEVYDLDPMSLSTSWGDGIWCEGDSGGAVLQRIDGVERLVGVIVRGGDCTETSHGFAARVAHYEDFIESVTLPRAIGCTTCREASYWSCAPDFAACDVDTECDAYQECVTACFELDDACTSACVRANEVGARRFAEALGPCECTECADACAHECTGPLMGIALEAAPDAGPTTTDAGSPAPDAGWDASGHTGDGGSEVTRTTVGCGCTAARSSGDGAIATTFVGLAIFVARRRRARLGRFDA